MGFEIRDGKEYLPPEDDIYGVDDAIEEREFNSLLLGMGTFSDDARLRRRRNIIIVSALCSGVCVRDHTCCPGLFNWLLSHR